MSYLILLVHTLIKIFHISHLKMAFVLQRWVLVLDPRFISSRCHTKQTQTWWLRPPPSVGGWIVFVFCLCGSSCPCVRVSVSVCFLESLPVQVLHILLSSSVGFLLRRVQKWGGNALWGLGKNLHSAITQQASSYQNPLDTPCPRPLYCAHGPPCARGL